MNLSKVSIFCHSTCLASGTGKIASGAFTGLQALNKREVIPAQRIKGCFFMGVIISDLLINMSCYKLSPKTK